MIVSLVLSLMTLAALGAFWLLSWQVYKQMYERGAIERDKRVILAALFRRGLDWQAPISGAELVLASGGLLKRSRVHVALSELEHEGLVMSHPVNVLIERLRVPRRNYAITDRGIAIAIRRARSEFSRPPRGK